MAVMPDPLLAVQPETPLAAYDSIAYPCYLCYDGHVEQYG